MDNNKLKFTRDDLLENEVITNCRNAKVFEQKYLRKSFNKKITVLRILDSRKENFNLSKEYKDKIDVINIITAPEIEMLIIINEGKYNEFSKEKSNKKPSDYCKINLKYKSVKKSDFVESYFEDIDNLTNAIKKYKKLSNIKKGELCLADLLK